LQAQFINTVQRQGQEQPDAALKRIERIAEGLPLPGFVNGRGVLYAPVGSHRLTWPGWANFASGVVTDSEYKIELRSVSTCELLPSF
jgi:hypothetical protein